MATDLNENDVETPEVDSFNYPLSETYEAIAPVIKNPAAREEFIARDALSERNKYLESIGKPTLDFESFKEQGATNEEIIEALTGAADRSTLGQAAESVGRRGVPALAGGKAAVAATKLFYNATPLLPPKFRIAGAALSGIGGFLAGYSGTDYLTQALFGERKEVALDDRPRQKLFDVAFESVLGGTPITKGIKEIPKGLGSFTEFFRKGSQLEGLPTEIAYGAGAGSGSYLSEKLFPGKTGAALGFELSGSVAGGLLPTGLAVRAATGAAGLLDNMVQKAKTGASSAEEARMNSAANFLFESFEKMGETPEVILKNLTETGRNSTIPAVKANSETLKSLVEYLSKSNPDFAKMMDAAALDDLDNINRGVLHTLYSGWTENMSKGGINPWAVASEVKIDQARNVFKAHVDSYAKKVDEVYQRILAQSGSDAARREASKKASELFHQSFRDIAAAVERSYDKIPKGLEVNDADEGYLLSALYKAKDQLNSTLRPIDDKFNTWVSDNYFYSKKELLENKKRELIESGLNKKGTSFFTIKDADGKVLGNSDTLSKEAIDELAKKTKGSKVTEVQSNPLQEALDEWASTAGVIVEDGKEVRVPLDDPRFNLNFFDKESDGVNFSEYIKPMSVKEMLDFRSTLLEESARAGREGYLTHKNAYRELGEGAFGVLESLKNDILVEQNNGNVSNDVWDSVLEAYEMTTARHDLFSRSYLANVLNKTSARGAVIPPELLLESGLTGTRSVDQTFLNYRDMVDGLDLLNFRTKKLGLEIEGLDPAAVESRLDDFNSAVSVFMNNLAQSVTKEVDGQLLVDQPKLNRFLEDNKEILQQNPQLATLFSDLTDLQKATSLFRTFDLGELGGEFLSRSSIARILSEPDEVFNAIVKSQARKQLWILSAGKASPVDFIQGVLRSDNPEKALEDVVKWTATLGKDEQDGFRDLIFDAVLGDLRNNINKNPEQLIAKVRKDLFGPLSGQTNQSSLFTILARNGIIDKQFTVRMKAILGELEDLSKIAGRKNVGLGEEEAVKENIFGFLKRKAARLLGAIPGRSLGTGTLQAPEATASFAEKMLAGVPDVAFQDVLIQLSLPGGEDMLELLLRKTPTEKKLNPKELAKQAKQAIKDGNIVREFFTRFSPVSKTAVVGSSARAAVGYQEDLEKNKERYRAIQERARNEIEERKQQRQAVPMGSNLPTTPNPASALSQAPASPQQRVQYADVFPNDITSNIIRSRNRGGIGSLV